MCYNKMYASKIPTVGQIAVSRRGHDEGRLYIIVAVLGNDFVMCADGKVRTLDKPKTKRIKHLKTAGESESAAKAIADGKLTDAGIRKILKSFGQKSNT